MFDDVHFTGTINLGTLVSALVSLIGVITVYIRIKAALAENQEKTGQSINDAVKKRLKIPRIKNKPVVQPPPDNVDKS